jgi:Mrp family chromosome partitioning ATPase
MGRTLDILKFAKAGSRPTDSEPLLEVLSIRPPASEVLSIRPASQDPETIPFIEVGGPNHAMHGSPGVLAQSHPKSKVEDRRSKIETPGTIASSIIHLQSSSNPPSSISSAPSSPEASSLSLAFHPLGSLIETATGLIAPDVAVYHQPDHPVSLEYRSAAAGIQQQLATGGTHVLLFTAVAPRAGTTTTVLNLALTWAKHEKRKVLVIDVAEARAAVAAKMGLSNTPGLGDVLKGTVPFAQALQETKQAHCWIMAAGETPAGPNAAAPEPKAMRDLLRQARKQFDLILLDALPWNDESATIALASGADGVYLVVRQSETKTAKVDDIIRRIQRHDIFLGGCVITHRKKE